MTDAAIALRIRPLGPGFGAEIEDVDVHTADDATLDAVVDTFHRHGAILLRGQTLDPGELTAFVARFGEPEDHTQKQFTLPGYPKVFVLSNREVDGKPIGAHNDGVGWHTDYSYKAEPVMCTMLYAVEVPIAVFWRFKTDFDNAWVLTNKFIADHRLVLREDRRAVTEARYATRPEAVFRWETLLDPGRYRLDFRLLNPEAC